MIIENIINVTRRSEQHGAAGGGSSGGDTRTRERIIHIKLLGVRESFGYTSMREALLLLLMLLMLLLLLLAVLLVLLLVMPMTHLILLKLHVRTAKSVRSCRQSKESLPMPLMQGLNCFDATCGGGSTVSRALWMQLS